MFNGKQVLEIADSMKKLCEGIQDFIINNPEEFIPGGKIINISLNSKVIYIEFTDKNKNYIAEVLWVDLIDAINTKVPKQ